MNELQYNELLNYAKSIVQFRQMVSSESKRPLAVRTLMYVADISSRVAWDFVNEYYDRMDLGMTSNRSHSFLNMNSMLTNK
jgi:hypothetical protein